MPLLQAVVNSKQERIGEGLHYGLCPVLFSSFVRCDCSVTRFASDNSTGSLPSADSDWLVRVDLDNARISSRISASRFGGSGDMLINVIDAADFGLCLLLPSF